MKIRSLQLKNIGVFEDETIAFPENKGNGAEIHILTGQNGTGKTTILQALICSLYRWQPFQNFDNDLTSKSVLNFIKKFNSSNEYTSFSKTSITRNSGYYVHDEWKLTFNGLTESRFVIPTSKFNKKEIVKFMGFAYNTASRFIDHQENINIKEKENYDPLEKTLEFDKNIDKDEYSLNQWFAVTMAKRNNAFFESNHKEVEKYSKSIDFLKKVVSDIVEIPIDFKFKNEKAKIVAIKQGQELDFDLLPDGLRSIISWLGDLIMRMDAIKWENDLAINEREFILFLDEIEVHLHPYWQRKILPVIQKTFQNAQIFITTHSPFIVNSVDGAWIYELDLDEKGNSKVTKIRESSTADSYQNVIRSIFDINGQYGKPVQDKLDDFYRDRTKIMNGESIDKEAFKENINSLLSLKDRSIEDKIHFELEQIGEEIEL